MTSNTTIYPLDVAELEVAVLELELEVVTVCELVVEVVFEVETVEDVGRVSELLLVVVLEAVDDVTTVSGLFVVVFENVEDVVTDSELLLVVDDDVVVVTLSKGTAWPSKTAREGKTAFT